MSNALVERCEKLSTPKLRVVAEGLAHQFTEEADRALDAATAVLQRRLDSAQFVAFMERLEGLVECA